MELCSFLVVHNDFRWNCVRVQQFIIIDGDYRWNWGNDWWLIVIVSGIAVVVSSL